MISEQSSRIIDNRIQTNLIGKYFYSLGVRNAFKISGSAYIVRNNGNGQSVVTFPNATTSSIPPDIDDKLAYNRFLFFVNGQLVEHTAIDEVYQSDTDFILKVDFEKLNYQILEIDEVVVWGNFVE